MIVSKAGGTCMKYTIDYCEINGNILKIQGWGFSQIGTPLEIKVNRRFVLKRVERLDVAAVFVDKKIDALCGFEIFIKKRLFNSLNSIVIDFYDSQDHQKCEVDDYLNRASEEEIEQEDITLAYQPLISVVIPVYNTKHSYFIELMESIKNQIYENWEVCLADGNSNPEFKEFLQKFESKKVKIKLLNENLGISGNTNEAIKIASGEYIAFCDHDDTLSKSALLDVARTINAHDDVDFIYTDEDKMSMDSSKFFQPNHKSDFNLNLLEVGNYINHLSVIRSDFLRTIGLLDEKYEGSQDYDLVLRIAENTDKIYHIKKIEYHWRCHEESVASNPESKLYAFDNAVKALKAHFSRIGEEVNIEKSEVFGSYKVTRNIKR